MPKPRLRVLAGTGTSPTNVELKPIHTGHPVKLRSDLFEGELVVHIKGLEGSHPDVRSSSGEYFAKPERAGITWSIQMQGRFLHPVSADDVLFGNTFDRPLGLPWGSGVALKFMHYIDPTVEHDLTSQKKPWALSPLIATMPHFVHERVSSGDEKKPEFLAPPSTRNATPSNKSSQRPPFPPPEPIADDTSQLHLARTDVHLSSGSSGSSHSSSNSVGLTSSADVAELASSSTSSLGSTLSVASTSYVSINGQTGSSPKAPSLMKKMAGKAKKKKSTGQAAELGLETAAQRRAYFSTAAHRRCIAFGPEDIITTDFCYGFLEFSPSLALRLPGGISFDLMRYWDGQPVRFVCCERKRASQGDSGDDESEPWGTVFWCVAIEMCSEEDDEEDE
ncbi:hypothetical protein DXG03_002425 [Asterophora parasitica]|uniref:Domain of unknown function at the cortex 1 domain-containing protein n=1 Tax=Asterophora parasitica TaxID=117018 RepID=A0A9P7GDK9_9AGAR|nr:hypothetical protein DXG03_002425 [Asterophora parasitica]